MIFPHNCLWLNRVIIDVIGLLPTLFKFQLRAEPIQKYIQKESPILEIVKLKIHKRGQRWREHERGLWVKQYKNIKTGNFYHKTIQDVSYHQKLRMQLITTLIWNMKILVLLLYSIRQSIKSYPNDSKPKKYDGGNIFC